MLTDFSKIERPGQLHLGFQALDAFQVSWHWAFSSTLHACIACACSIPARGCIRDPTSCEYPRTMLTALCLRPPVEPFHKSNFCCSC